MVLVTDSLIRQSRAVSLILGVLGVSLAATLYVAGAAPGILAFGVGVYAIGCAAIVFALARARTALPEAALELQPPDGQTVARAPTTSDANAGQDAGPGSDVSQSDTPDLRDPLTGLPTHVLLRDRLTHALARAHRHERPVAVMLLDIDGFRAINDAFGFGAGDRVLAAVAARLNSTLRGGDTASRLGADEFGLLLEDMAEESNFVQVSERISEAIARPITIDGREITISACTGIARATPDDDADTLMQNVDAALAAAKRRGRGACEVFSDRIRTSLIDRVELEAELRTAVDAHAFDIEYQPIVILHSRRIAGVEALLRWRHSTRGDIPPSTFLPVADELGISPALGRWVLEQACRTAARWPGYVSVNVSSRQLAVPGLAEDIARALRQSGVEPQRLALELTESVLIEETEAVEGLRALGVRLMLDDFGTGYSTLDYVRRFPPDAIKIDRSFIAPLAEDAGARHIVQAIVGMATGLGVGVIAEGLETEAQAIALTEIGCDVAQGFGLHRPMLAEAIERLLR